MVTKAGRRSQFKSVDSGPDLFTQIANHRQEKIAAGLAELSPMTVPDFLFSPQTDFITFPRSKEKNTDSKLDGLLAKERRRFAPFLQDLAPALESTREILPIGSFQWRMETAHDLADAASIERGDGDWTIVAIPHYGGPVGVATALYRSVVTLSAEHLEQGAVWLCFDGVDYIAEVHFNGRFVGRHEGFFAPFELDATTYARVGANVLVVTVRNDGVHLGTGKVSEPIGDKIYAATGPGWDEPHFGWHHCPPGMGIYQPVRVECRPLMAITSLFVRPLADEHAQPNGQIEAWVELTLPKRPQWQIANLRIRLTGRNFRGLVQKWTDVPITRDLGSGRNDLRLPLTITNPRIWTPDQPWLYDLHVEISDEKGEVQDRRRCSFGLRTFSIDEVGDAEGIKGRMFLNGREIRLRGANTMGFEQQDVMRGDDARLIDGLLLAKVGGMNFLRLTQRPVQDRIYQVADAIGLLIQTDFPLFSYLRRPQFCEAVRQAEEMERLIRPHPSCIVSSYINEPVPGGWGGRGHRQCTRAELENFFQAANCAVRLANPDRAIKPIDGDYDAPGPGLPDQHCYTMWYNGHGLPIGKLHQGWWIPAKRDWMVGCGEFGAEGLDHPDLMRRRYPASWLPQNASDAATWTPARIPFSQTWNMHFMLFERPQPTEASWDPLVAWAQISQSYQALATRLMTEALRRIDRMNTFAIHLFIDAWPSGWMKTIMDCERRPKPSFWAYRSALSPIHVHTRTDRFSWTSGEIFNGELWLCNDTHEDLAGANLHWQMETENRVISGGQAPAQARTCAPAVQGRLAVALPEVAIRATITIRLTLVDSAGRVRHQHTLDLALFPHHSSGNLRVAALGHAAKNLLHQLDLQATPLGRADAVIVEHTELANQTIAIRALLSRGGTVLVLPLPTGHHDLLGEKIEIQTTAMGEYDFAARVSGHQVMNGCGENDLRLWHDELTGRITPFLKAVIEPTPGWTPIATTGSGVFWGGPGLHLGHAIQELRLGGGTLRLTQIQLLDRTKTNPAARALALNLLKPGVLSPKPKAVIKSP